MAGLQTRVRELISLIRPTPSGLTSPEARSRERHRRIVLTSATNLFAKGLALLVNLVVVRLVLGSVGKEQYGLWVAITSVVVWASLLDFGILNGLVNAIAEAHGRDDRDAVVEYVSTAFVILVLVTTALIIVFGFMVRRVSWVLVFSAAGIVPDRTLQWCVVAAAAPIVASFPLSIVRQLYAGLQKSYVGNAFAVAGSMLSLAATAGAVALKMGLPALILALGIGPMISAAVNFVYLLRVEMPWIAPSVRRVSLIGMRRLLKSSVPLFLFQGGALLVNNSQPLLLAHLSSLSEVADYSLLLRVGGLLAGVAILATSPFVPAFREAYERGDGDWVRINFRRMVFVRVLLASGAGILLLLGGNLLLRIWLGQATVAFGASTWLVLAIIILFSAWGSGFMDVLAIMDRIWVLVGFVMVNGLGTVFLTLILVPRLGVVGALLAYGFATVVLWSWASVLLYQRLLRGGGGSAVRIDGNAAGALW